MASCSCGWRGIVWGTWAIHVLISATYMGLVIFSGNKIQKTTILGDNNGQLYKSGLMACVVLSFIVVHLFLTISPFILARRMFSSEPALSYGMLIGSGWNSAWVLLLSGLVLNYAAQNLETQLRSDDDWSASDINAFQATYAFAYILCGSFVILTVLLFVGRGAFNPKASGTANGVGVQSYQVGGAGPAATVGTTGGHVELPAGGNTTQWPPPGGATTGANSGAGAWNGGTHV